MTLAYILDHGVCCASDAAGSDRSLHFITGQLRMKYSSSNCPNHVRRTKSSIKKRIIVRRSVRSIFGEQTVRPIKNGLYKQRKRNNVLRMQCFDLKPLLRIDSSWGPTPPLTTPQDARQCRQKDPLECLEAPPMFHPHTKNLLVRSFHFSDKKPTNENMRLKACFMCPTPSSRNTVANSVKISQQQPKTEHPTQRQNNKTGCEGT